MKIKDQVSIYLKHLKAAGCSPFTLTRTKYSLRKLLKFLEEEHIEEIEDLTRDLLQEYQQELAFYLTAKGKPLARTSQIKLLSVVKGFTKFLNERDYLVHDPGKAIKLPKKPRRLPKVILDHNEIKKLIKTPDTRTNKGFRNRVILEILYDTGIRRSELSNIRLFDLDLNGGYIHIHGKGDKERVVPLSRRVCSLIHDYILGVRPSLLQGDDDGYLILNRWGRFS